MAEVKVTTIGKQAKSDLPEARFTESFHESLVHDAVRARVRASRACARDLCRRIPISVT